MATLKHLPNSAVILLNPIAIFNFSFYLLNYGNDLLSFKSSKWELRYTEINDKTKSGFYVRIYDQFMTMKKSPCWIFHKVLGFI